MRKIILLMVMVMMVSFTLVGFAQTEKELLIKAAKNEIEDLALPYTSNYEITYDEEDRSLVIIFDTSEEFKVDYNIFYLRWWDAQFIALDCFERRDIPLNSISVITNFVDRNDLFKASTKVLFVRRYANILDGMWRWLDLTEGFLWDKKTESWQPVEP